MFLKGKGYMSFKDLFSAQASDYSRYRPTYPAELFDWLVLKTQRQNTAWDVGTGNGQAAAELAKRFKRVLATDPSEKQLAEAVKNPRIEYRVCSAEESGLRASSIDLITVAQAYHWFKHDKFHEEVKRIASKDGAVLAVWSYGFCHISENVDRAVMEYYDKVVGPYWDPERKLVETGYRSIRVPFKEETDVPKFEIKANWNLSHLVGYLATWSATQKATKELGSNPLEKFAPKLEDAWGSDRATEKQVVWPISLRLFKVN